MGLKDLSVRKFLRLFFTGIIMIAVILLLVLDDKGYTGSRIWAALDGDFVCVGSHFPALF